ncbi:lactate permease [Sinobaca qinghaiensis]|uniref:L-lactate permease n=1 Tax=Sinobaca qinghaiensis TaxID=342944 RepID=A0A419V023_9BACL|nr:L-lactate permease [Sinobaca qinghaiensis]RKD71294.1 lactate permease [Sinobaca qinghaiensis]
MWYQQYDPFGNEWISALIAFLPILLFLLAMTVFKMKGVYAAALSLAACTGITILFFDMPAATALSAVILGFGRALWPIGYIVIMAVWLYKIAVETGKFDIIRGSIANISQDHRLQLLLIGFSFNAFLEGAAGFGVPIAISAALLVTLGFKPLKAAGLCLIANAASGAFGAIGIPVITGAQVGGLETLELSRMLAWILPGISFAVPFILIFILDGRKGVKEILPALFVVSGTYTLAQIVTIVFMGPELANILSSLLSMVALAVFLRTWQPKTIYREPGAEVLPEKEHYSFKQIIVSWSPFYILTAVIAVWSLPSFQALFAEGGRFASTTLALQMPALHQQVMQLPPIAAVETAMDAVWSVNLLSATGTAILVSILLTSTFFPSLNGFQTMQVLGKTIKELWLPVLTICLVMAFANLSNYAGLSASMGLALSKTGMFFPFVSPVLGWIGVFLTGSVVNNNALFGSLQVVTANQIGTSPALLLASNTAGGVMGKLISPQSIAIAAAAVQQTGKESELFKFTLRYSLALLFIVCLLTFVLSFIFTT